jgi:hypothetical protein
VKDETVRCNRKDFSKHELVERMSEDMQGSADERRRCGSDAERLDAGVGVVWLAVAGSVHMCSRRFNHNYC